MNITYDNDTINEIASHLEAVIRLLGEDPEREGLKKTPVRAAKALYYVTNGYRRSVDSIVNGAVFTHDGSGMIVVKDIEFYSMCEHHILPFFGRLSVGYIPDGKILGLSKLARIVDHYARRLQVQERLTAQVGEEIMRVTGAKGVMLRCEAQHLCMKMRGVEKQDSTTVTVDSFGLFNDSPALRSEFLASL